jgi:hypothetical protein
VKSPTHPLASSATPQFGYLATHTTLTIASSTNIPLNPSDSCVFFTIPFGTCTSRDLGCKCKSEVSQLPAYLSILCGIGNLAKLAAIEVTWRFPVLVAPAITSFFYLTRIHNSGIPTWLHINAPLSTRKKKERKENPHPMISRTDNIGKLSPLLISLARSSSLEC